MLTISNFPGKYRLFSKLSIAVILAGFLIISCRSQRGYYVQPQASNQAPNAPHSMIIHTDIKPPPVGNYQDDISVELESVTVSRMDSTIAILAGREFLRTATNPIVIEVKTKSNLDITPRTSWPVIELNGKKIANTRIIANESNKLVAFLADRTLINTNNKVTVVWVGNEELTRTKKPLFFTSEDVQQ